MNTSELKIQALLAQVLNSRIGLAVTTSSAQNLRQRVYNFRTKHKDLFPEFAAITFTLDPDDQAHTLWLIRTERNSCNAKD